MDGILVKLKAILNGLSDEELNKYDLWINAYKTAKIIVVDDNSISLITDSDLLKIDKMIL